MWLFRIALFTTAVAFAASDFQRGVNFTAEFPSGYGSEGAEEMLRKLPRYGVNAIALVPYGFMPGASSPRIVLPRSGGGLEREDGIKRLAAVAHELGMKVLLKPQIWLRGSYPGDVDFRSSADVSTWFEQYRNFIEHEARLAADMRADLFCVGVEFGKLVRYEKNWRDTIARVRKIYHGPLVYAANAGPEFEALPFWDALDYVGLNEYYPLPDDFSTVELVRKVQTVQRKWRKPVIFTEAGFSSYEAPHRAPWDETPRKLAPADQAKCYEAVFRAFYKKPWFRGMYWWKIGTNGFGGAEDGSHTPWNKPAMQVMQRWYLHGGR